MKNTMNRRQLFGQISHYGIASIGLLGGATFVSATASAADLKLVDPAQNPIAKAIKYVHDATKAKRADKMGVAAKDQLCSNCALYKPADKKIDKKDVGNCSMIAGHYVAAAGWCASWVPGPTATKKKK
jgi:hypothetical protein